MRKPEDQLTVVNESAETISESVGISPERTKEITDRVDEIAREEIDKGEDGSSLKVFINVYNEFENPVECAFAMFILTHEEGKVALEARFRLPASVANED